MNKGSLWFGSQCSVDT